MSGDPLAVFLFLTGTMIAFSLAAFTVGRGRRANALWLVAFVFLIATIWFPFRSSQVDVAALWSCFLALEPLIVLGGVALMWRRPGQPLSIAPRTAPRAANTKSLLVSEPNLPKSTKSEPEERTKRYVPDAISERYLELIKGDASRLMLDDFLEPYAGDWLRLEGIFVSASALNPGYMVTLYTDVVDSKVILAIFGEDQKSYISKIENKSKIRLEGCISKSGSHYMLTKAKLL